MRYRMDPNFDIAKFVGAASAPVTLIIATVLFLANLTTRWWAVSGLFHQLTGEYRAMGPDHGSTRSDKVRLQVGYYTRRLKLLQWATTVLTVAILFFILTVLFTGLNILVPRNPTLMVLTIFYCVAGLLLLSVAVSMELIQNNMGRRATELEMEEFPELADAGRQSSLEARDRSRSATTV